MKFGLRCHNCDHFCDPETEQRLAYLCHMQEWGFLPTTACDECGAVGKLGLESESGIPVTSKLGYELISIKEVLN